MDSPILTAWPILGLLLASGLVLLAAEIVKAAVAWFRERLQRRAPGRVIPHWLIHTANFALSAGVGYAFVMEGRLEGDAAFAGIAWPWNWLIFTLAVALRAGGAVDLQRREKPVININKVEVEK